MAFDLSKLKKHEKYQENIGKGARDVIPGPVIKAEKKESISTPTVNSTQVAKNILGEEDIQKMTSQKMNASSTGYRNTNKKNTNNVMPIVTSNNQSKVELNNAKNEKMITPYQENKNVTKKKPKDPNESTYFTKGAFEDGYQLGDVTKTILGTSADVATNVTKGIMGIGESVGDVINLGVARQAERNGNTEKAEDYKNRATANSVEDFFGR